MHLLCPHCQNPIEFADTARPEVVLCPTCGSNFRLEAERTRSYHDQPKRLGKFELLENVGAGAFGVVWKAHDTELKRLVAVKIPHSGRLGTPKDEERFLREGRSAAQLRHPSIVSVHEVGRHEGLPYLIGDFISGVTLADFLTARRLSFRESAELVAQMAEALAYAHSMGVVHRDVKPSNIMLDRLPVDAGGGNTPSPLGKPLLMDFGLALRDEAEVTMTLEGQILGTPAYMSPEQAAGWSHKVDARSDIYSLGVVLYQLLTGELPFRGNSRMLMDQVLREDPRLPRRLNDKIPRDLETIALKCLSKPPERRFQTAGELAADLRRWLAGEPIKARPIGVWERGLRWTKRRPAAALLLVVSCLAVLSLLSGALWHNAQLREANRFAQDEEKKARGHLYHALVGQARALRLARIGGYRKQAWSCLQDALALETAEKNKELLRREAIGCMGDFVGLEPTVWQNFPADISVLALSPRGDQLAIGLYDGTVVLRDTSTGVIKAQLAAHPTRVHALVFGPDERMIVTADGEGTIKVWEPDGLGCWRSARKIAAANPGNFIRAFLRHIWLAITPDGKFVAACSEGSSTISMWRLADGVLTGAFSAGELRLRGMALSSDGRLLAAGYESRGMHGIVVWDVSTRKIEHRLPLDLGYVLAVGFSRDGKFLACGCIDGLAIYEASGFQPHFIERCDCSLAVAFGPDRDLVAIPSWHLDLVRLWDPLANQEIAVLSHPGQPHSVEFSRPCRLLAAADERSVRIWQLLSTREKLVLPGQSGGISGVAFSPDGKLLASAGKDKKVTVWNPFTGQAVKELTDFQSGVQTVAFSPNGCLLAAGEFGGGAVRIWKVPSRAETPWAEMPPPEQNLGPEIWSVAFSPDGTLFAAAGQGGMRIWSVLDGGREPIPKLQILPGPVDTNITFLCFSPDSKCLAWVKRSNEASGGNTAHLWDVQNGQAVVARLPRLGSHHRSIAFLSEAKRLLFVNEQSDIEVWNLAEEKPEHIFSEHVTPHSASHLAACADGRWVAASCTQSISVWDTAMGKLLFTLPHEHGNSECLDWGPNRALLAIGSHDGTLAIWNIPEMRSQLAAIGLDW